MNRVKSLLVRRVTFRRYAIIALAWVATGLAQGLPIDAPDSEFEIEPPLLLPGERSARESEEEPKLQSAPAASVEKFAARYERAKRAAADGKRLFKMGVLSKVEVEERELRIVRTEADLEQARVERLQDEFRELHARVAAGEALPQELESAEGRVAAAMEKANSVAKRRDQAELAAAERNVGRQRKLFALGSGRKSDLNRAEQRLAALKAKAANSSPTP